MKKLYRKGTVHPSPPPPPISDQFSLSFLPAAILTLAAALSSSDKEVLSYLLSSGAVAGASRRKKPQNRGDSHPPSFTCYCFTCYTNYWARWDSSPNRQLIHEILDAFEDGLLLSSSSAQKKGINRREKRKNSKNRGCDDLSLISDNGGVGGDNSHLGGLIRVNNELGRVDSVEQSGEQAQLGCCETGEKQGSGVRKIVSFIGERIWGSVWG